MLTGGQDDLISIWHVPGSALIARCQGHRSFVTSVAFDPWRCDDRNYRFGSVGEDRRLCLWDFSVGMLHRPRGAGAAPTARHGSVASRGTALARAETKGSERLDGGADGGAAAPGRRGLAGPHPVEPRASTAMLPPVLSKVVDADPLAWLEFTENAIMTSCKSGMSSRLYHHALPYSFRSNPSMCACSSSLLLTADVTSAGRLFVFSWTHRCQLLFTEEESHITDHCNFHCRRAYSDLDATIRLNRIDRWDLGELQCENVGNGTIDPSRESEPCSLHRLYEECWPGGMFDWPGPDHQEDWLRITNGHY